MRRTLGFLIFLAAGHAGADDGWPQYLGPHRNGRVDAPAALFAGTPTLTLRWMQPLGSGYAQVLAFDGRLVTQFQEGANDVLACFDAATGTRLWTYAYAPTYAVEAAAEPGPLSTPIRDGDRIYALGARADLLCVAAADGRLIWRRDLRADMDITVPQIGMVASPLITGDLLVLTLAGSQTGMVAFDKHTGTTVRTHAGGFAGPGSPSHDRLLGRAQLLAAIGDEIHAVDPDSGATLWTAPHANGTQLTAIDDRRLLVDSGRDFVLYALAKKEAADTAAGYTLTRLWQTSALGLEYTVPVYHDGALYGFKNQFLSCLDAATGRKLWSSRDTGRGMILLVGDHLAVLGHDGALTLAPASPAGFTARARLQVFTKSGLTAPSYADGVFYMRNHTHLAAVAVGASAY